MKPAYDVVVVGSGYGGGVSASRLTRMGYRVAILERGLEHLPGEYPDTPTKALAQIQISGSQIGRYGRPTAIFDLHVNPDMNVLVGCGLGGTSLINANVAIEVDKRVFEDPKWPSGIVDADLEEGYRRARTMLSPEPYPLNMTQLNKLKALERAATALGVTYERPPINVTFEERVNSAGVHQRACTLCGDCCSGCNVGAKNTTLMNYVADAAAGGAEVFCGVRVRAVGRAAGGWRIAYVPLGFGRQLFADDESTVSARIVVLAAGTLGSTEILLRSRDRGLSVSSRIGTGFTGNGDVLAFGYNNDMPIDGIGIGVEAADYDPAKSNKRPVGPTIAGLIDLRATPELDDGIVIEEGVIPGGLGSFLPDVMAIASVALGRDTDEGDRLSEISREVESLTFGPYRGAVNQTQTFLAMAHDGSNGEMRLAQDRLVVDWPAIGSSATYGRIAEKIRTAVQATGGTYVPNPIWSKLMQHRLVTVHPLGGCPMGKEASLGVLDGDCRVYAGNSGTAIHPGLYVCDGSMIPRSLGVNPLLTISAISERAMIRLAQREKRNIDLTPRQPAADAAAVRTTGIQFTERMSGTIQPANGGPKSDASFICTVHAQDANRFINERDHEAELIGTFEAHALSPDPLTVSGGRFNLFIVDPGRVETKQMNYAMPLTARDGGRYFMRGIKSIHDDRGFDLWRDTTTLAVTIHQGADESGPVLYEGILNIAAHDFINQLRTMVVTDAPNLSARLKMAADFGRFFAGRIFDSFGGPIARPVAFDPHTTRIKRPLRVSAPEVHFFDTADGKKLRLTRYKGGRKGPVIFVHGLGVSSLIFSIDTIDTNMLEFVYAAGYDCWLLDYRASTDLQYSHEQWNADVVAKYDYQPAVDYVRNRSGSNTVQMLTHCYGAMTFSMAMLTGLKYVRAAAISQISTHAVVPWLPQRILAYLHAPDLLHLIGIKLVDARSSVDRPLFERIVDVIIGFGYPFRSDDRSHNLTSRRITALYGQLYQLQQLNEGTLEAMPEMFGTANVTAFRHLSAIARAGHVIRADGTDDYLCDANLRNFAIPTLFFHGTLNHCFAPPGTIKTMELLAGTNGRHLYERHVIAETGHLDSIFGKNAARDVYPAVVSHLNQTARE
ncbi:choline dehydrogenase [Nordella sp. HKS 07]|uniref:alpha/beta fold hydrolase n=1 Tax=Nordella sp. HKS 07 TaxID=2712222 RepID=UPI0013E1CA83|nr:alpha/beta fold hydrolase [Nordella sp. HKS 07]QIG49479.1 choline dehydrogenase [Nordella sp. HKS 07]